MYLINYLGSSTKVSTLQVSLKNGRKFNNRGLEIVLQKNMRGGWKFFCKKICAGMLIRDLRVAEIVLLMKLDGGHLCWQIWVFGNFLFWQTGVVTTLLDSHKVSAIWVWKIFQKFTRKLHGEPLSLIGPYKI